MLKQLRCGTADLNGRTCERNDVMSEAGEILTGDRNECGNCGQGRPAHTGVLNDCPSGSRYQRFRAKFDFDGELDIDYTDNPVCPWCGDVYTIEDHYECYQEDDTQIDCPGCDRPFYSSASVTYNFTTRRQDAEAERVKKESDEARREKRRLERLAKCEPFTPGLRVRVSEKTHKTRLCGMYGTVTNKELSKHNPFVNVTLDTTEDFKGYGTFFDAKDLERVG